MGDQNLFVLEVRHGIILFLNERTQVEDGWHWGLEEQFVAGPFKSYKAAVKHARRNGGKGLELAIWTEQNSPHSSNLPRTGTSSSSTPRAASGLLFGSAP